MSTLSFTLISIAICASPGPSMFFVLSNGLSGDKIKGLTAVLSLTSANMIWVTLSVTGIAALIHSSVVAFEVLRFAGAAYLIYMGGNSGEMDWTLLQILLNLRIY